MKIIIYFYILVSTLVKLSLINYYKVTKKVFRSI